MYATDSTPMKSITDLYQHYLAITNDPQAAATLVLAHVTSQERPENLSVKQAAAHLGVSIEKIYALCRSGELRHSKIGRTIRIQAHDLQDLFRCSRSAAGACLVPDAGHLICHSERRNSPASGFPQRCRQGFEFWC